MKENKEITITINETMLIILKEVYQKSQEIRAYSDTLFGVDMEVWMEDDEKFEEFEKGNACLEMMREDVWIQANALCNLIYEHNINKM